jgi:hypothetical protein
MVSFHRAERWLVKHYIELRIQVVFLLTEYLLENVDTLGHDKIVFKLVSSLRITLDIPTAKQI